MSAREAIPDHIHEVFYRLEDEGYVILVEEEELIFDEVPGMDWRARLTELAPEVKLWESHAAGRC